jgi:zinc/manganese transport system substrate-binding protein
MKIYRSLALLALLLTGRSALAKVNIVATVTDLGAIAREVVGDQGSVTVLARPTQDPHFVDARPNLMLSLNRADALILIGAELEVGWLPVLLKGARNSNIISGSPGYIDASSLISLKDVPRTAVDRSMGDIHPTGNPHITTDPENAIVIARGVAERLAGIDQSNAGIYRANAEKFAKALEVRIAHWKAEFVPFQGKPVITFHRSWVYFTDFAGLREAGTLEPKPGIPPNAPHLAEIIGLMNAEKIPLILQESWYGSSVGELVAQKTGAKLVVVPGMTREGQSYTDHIDDIVQAVVAALKGR